MKRDGKSYGIFSQFSRKLDAPPWMMTVAITISEVVVSIACRASDTVFRMARANDIAPLRPKENKTLYHTYLN